MANYDASVRVNTKVDNSDLRKLEQSFSKVEQTADSANQKIKQQEGTWDSLSAKAEHYKTELRALEDKGYGFGDQKYDDLYIGWQNAEYAVKKYKDTLNSITDQGIEKQSEELRKVKEGFSKVSSIGKKCFGVLQKGTKKSNGLFSTMVSRLKGIALSLLVFNWITKGFNAMVSAFKEGFKNLAQYSKDYNAAMSDMKSRCAELKNNLAAAFEPIVRTIIPCITQLVSWLNTAAESVSKFLAIISGKSTYTRAKKQVVDYAKSLDNANKSASGALASFDEINVLNKDEGNGAAGGEATGADAFEDVQIGSITDWTQQFKSAIENGDWQGVGSLVGEKMNFAFSTIDFSQAGLQLGEKVKDLLGLINGFLQEVDWQEIGGKCAEFVAGIDWSGVVSGISEGIGSLCGGLAGLIWGFIKPAWNEMVSWWKGVAFEDGKFTMEGLLLGIWEKIKDIGNWIKEHIFDPFIQGFKNAFGIHSPSTVMQEMGGYIIDGLKLGLTGIWDNVKGIVANFKENIETTFTDIKTNVLSVFASMKEGVENKFSEIRTFISQVIERIKNTISQVLGRIKEGWLDAWDKMKTGVISIFNNIYTKIKVIINSIITIIEKMVNRIINGVNAAIDALNGMGFDVPDWVPYIGGSSFHLNISRLSEVSIPRLATGGIVTSSTLANIGEAGREAVLPLDNNTGWMDDLANKINGDRTINITFEGSLAELGRILKPVIDTENSRVGRSLVQA